MKNDINKGIYIKEELDFVPTLKKNNTDNSKKKDGKNDTKKSKKSNGKI